MYINDVHIFTYIIFFILGAIVGQFTEWVNKRVLEDKRIFSKDIKLELKKKLKINYFSVLTIAILYVIVLYKFGIKSNLLGNLNLIKYIFLIPVLISIIVIDYKKRIIPNRLTFTLFEGGVIFTFLYGIDNLFLARDYLLGMIVGLAIFAVIAMLGRIIAGKEAMGLRRCEINCNFRVVFWYGINYINSYNIIYYCRCYKCNYNNIQKKKEYKK